MKKYLAFILVIILLFSLASCKKIPITDSSSKISVDQDFVYVTESDFSQIEEVESTTQQESIPADREKTPQSTVVAPTTVTFYKDGKQSVSADKELNHKIAKHIEEWYKDADGTGVSCNCVSTDADVLLLKNTETAIELEFDDDIVFFGNRYLSHGRKIFIPLTGEKDYIIFSKGKAAGNWYHYYPNGSGLEKYFEGREYEEIPNDRWQSTITAPARIQLYRNGELSEEHTDQDFNLKVAQYVESWYLYETSINSTENDAYIDVVKKIRTNDTYVEITFHSEIKIYGENLLSPETYCLLIPLSGESAGCVFEAGKDYNYKTVHMSKNAQKMDHFFESLNDDNG